MKNVNPRAGFPVKLDWRKMVSALFCGVVAKATADSILISGDSAELEHRRLSSIKHAGIPWEIGLAEVQQCSS